jgi:hypothetical protein
MRTRFAQELAKEATMSPEERQLLSSLFDRIKSAAATPRDADAEAFINQSVRDQPYAPYLLSQAVIMQEQGMKAAADRIQQLEARVHELEQGAGNQQQGGGSFLGGLGSLFGGGQPSQPQHAPSPQQNYAPQPSYAPQQGYAPQQQPTGPWSQQPAGPSAGGSFLRGALGTAAGVAGGVMLAESLSSLFSPHLGGLGGASALGGLGANATPAVEETVVNNYYGKDDNNGQSGNDSNDANDQTFVSDDDNDDNNFDDGSNGGDDSFNV